MRSVGRREEAGAIPLNLEVVEDAYFDEVVSRAQMFKVRQSRRFIQVNSKR